MLTVRYCAVGGEALNSPRMDERLKQPPNYWSVPGLPLRDHVWLLDWPVARKYWHGTSEQ